MIITTESRTVYTVKLKWGKRSYLTKLSAAKRAAREKIQDRYPNEPPCYSENGRLEYPGCHWSDALPKMDVLYRRLTAMYLKSIK
jgi:hypothetical protein